MSDRSANLVLGADISGLLKGYSDAANAGNEYNKNAKAAVEALSSTFNKAEEGTMGLMQAHRAAAKSAQELAQSTGLFSEETQIATEYAAGLAHKLTEWKAIEQTYKPGGSSELLGKSLSTAGRAAGGLAAGMALIGVEDDKVMKKVMELQSIMMMAEAVKSVGELKNAWIEMSVGLEAMMAANPIGLLVVGLVAAGAAAYALYSHFKEQNDELNNFTQREREAKEAADKFCESIDKETRSIIAKNQELQKEIVSKQRGITINQLSIEQLEKVNQKNIEGAKALDEQIFQLKLKDFWDTKQVPTLEAALAVKNADIEATKKQIEALREKQGLEHKNATTESPVKALVSELEQKKAYQSAFNNWSLNDELKLLQAQAQAEEKGTQGYINKLNEIKIKKQEIANVQAGDVFLEFGIKKDNFKIPDIGPLFNPKDMEIKYSLNFGENTSWEDLKKADEKLKAEKDQVLNEVNKDQENIIKTTQSFNKKMIGLAANTGLGFISQLGAAMAGQKIDWGKEILVSLAQFAGEYGAGLIAVGTAMNIAVPGSGVTNIWAGASLEAAAAFIGGYAGSMGSSSGSGASSSSASSSSQASSSSGSINSSGYGNLVLTTQLSGRNMQIMLGRNNYITGRVG